MSNRTTSGAPLPDPGRALRRVRELHRRYRARLKRLAQHVILDLALHKGEVWAPDLDDLPPGPSGNRSYIGTAFTGLERAGMIRRTDPNPSQTGRGGRHFHFLFRWRLGPGVDLARVDAWKRTHLPPPDDGLHLTDDPVTP